MFKDSFEARFENVGGCVDRTHAHLVEEGIDDYVASICMLALSEALNNVVEHSYAESDSGEVELHVEVGKDYILFQVKDRGLAPPDDLYVNAGEMPDPLDLPEGGWGLAVIGSVMDNVGYCHKDGFNQLELMKRIAPCF